MNSQNKKIILFDFDGVLVDTLNIYHAISSEVNLNLGIEEYKSFFEGNIYNAKRTDGTERMPHSNFHERILEHIREMKVPAILKDAVVELSKSYQLFIVSSSLTAVIDDILKVEGIADYFTEILGSDTHNSKVIKNKMILEKYAAKSEDSVFVTDTLGDIREAHECGIPSIAVTWGWHDRKTLEKGNPVSILDDPQELVSAIQNVLK